MSDRRKRAEALAAQIDAPAPESENTPPPEAPPAAAASESPPAPSDAPPQAAPPEAPPAGATPAEVVDWRARYENESKTWSAREQELKRQNEGILRDLQETRLRQRILREQGGVTPSAAPGAPPAAPQRIPVEFDAEGNAFVKPEVLSRFIPQQDNRETLALRREIRQTRVVAENPTVYAPVEQELGAAYQMLDTMVRRKQAERDAIGLFSPIRSGDEAVEFIEQHVAAEFRAMYPDLAPDKDALRDLVEFGANPGIEEATLRRAFKRVVDRRAPAAAGNGHDPAAPPPRPVDPNRPRPHGERGGKSPAPVLSSHEREIEELMERDFLTLTPKERERFRFLRRQIDAKSRERDEQGRFQ